MLSFLNKTVLNTYTNFKFTTVNFLICLQLNKNLKNTQQMFLNSFLNSSFLKSSKIKIKSPLYLKAIDENFLPDFKNSNEFLFFYFYKNLYFVKKLKDLDLSFIKIFNDCNTLLNLTFIWFIKKIIVYTTTNITFSK